MPARGFSVSREHAASATSAVLVAITIAAIAVRPAWLFVDDVALRAGLETLAGLAALAAAVAALTRFKRTGAGNDLALALGLVIISLTSVLLGVLALYSRDLGSSVQWLPMPARWAGAALLILAGRARVSRPRHLPGLPWIVALSAGLTAALTAVGAALGWLSGGTVPEWIQLVTIAFYLVGALGVFMRAQRIKESALEWFAAGVIGIAMARLAFTALAPISESWFSPGDALKVVTGLVLLMAVRAEVLAHTRKALESVLEQERSRMARDIHDGMAQELAFIVSQSRHLAARSPDATTLKLLAEAGQTALADARGMMYDLKRPSTTALSAVIAERSLRITKRTGLALEFEVDGEVPVEPEIEHTLLRIVAEAVSNASKHGNASTVSIRLGSEEGHMVVRVSDDGCGFDVRRPRHARSFGLTGMSQRVEALGGRFQLESEPGRGTMIEVAI